MNHTPSVLQWSSMHGIPYSNALPILYYLFGPLSPIFSSYTREKDGKSRWYQGFVSAKFRKQFEKVQLAEGFWAFFALPGERPPAKTVKLVDVSGCVSWNHWEQCLPKIFGMFGEVVVIGWCFHQMSTWDDAFSWPDPAPKIYGGAICGLFMIIWETNNNSKLMVHGACDLLCSHLLVL